MNNEQIAMMVAVKANGYGHGAVEVAKSAIEAGVNQLAVAFVDEAIELREAGITVPILILGYTSVATAEYAIQYDVMMTVYRIEDLQGINEIAQHLQKKAHIQIKIDTGMSRIGLQEEEVKPFLEELNRMEYVEVVGIFTHYSTADEIDKSYTNMQTSLFEKAVNTAKELEFTSHIFIVQIVQDRWNLATHFKIWFVSALESMECILQKKWIMLLYPYSLRCH